MIVPTYWARKSSIGWQPGDAIYDHPTALDGEDTLSALLRSLETLEDRDFKLVILAVPTNEDIATEVENRVEQIIKVASAGTDVEILLFGPSALSEMHDRLMKDGRESFISLLQLSGYSNVRNMCLFAAHLLGSEAAILIDDDEVFEDPYFLAKAKEFIGQTIEGKTVDAIAGYYLQPNGNYKLKVDHRPWMDYWDQADRMNEGFDRIIGTGPRLKETPFVFGGNMVVHRRLFMNVPFDPFVRRGEDIDFLMNARMFGFNFFLDNLLSIKHLAPPKTHPVWMRLREDIYRFIYERSKLEHQQDREGMVKINAGDFDPYPGCFLKPDLEAKIIGACRLLAQEYSENGANADADESLNNIRLANEDAGRDFNPFLKLCEIQKAWHELMEYVDGDAVRESLAKSLEGSYPVFR